MPLGEEYSSTLLVEVDGAAAAGGRRAAAGQRVRRRQHATCRTCSCCASATRSATVLAKAGFEIGAKVGCSVQTSGAGGPQPLLSGEVTALEIEVDHGRHPHRRPRHGPVAPAVPRPPGRGVRQHDRLATSPARSPSAPGSSRRRSTQPARCCAHVTQDGVSDWDFLRRLADEIGAVVAVVDGKLDFTQAGPQATRRPGRSRGPARTRSCSSAASNLVTLRATVTAADQVPEVEVRGWDVDAKREVVAVAAPRTRQRAARRHRPRRTGREVRQPALRRRRRRARTSRRGRRGGEGARRAPRRAASPSSRASRAATPQLRAGTAVDARRRRASRSRASTR